MIWSQENCLINNHRLTCERWGRGFLDTKVYVKILVDAKIFFIICFYEQLLFCALKRSCFILSKSFSLLVQPGRETLLIYFFRVCFARACGKYGDTPDLLFPTTLLLQRHNKTSPGYFIPGKPLKIPLQTFCLQRFFFWKMEI